PGYQAVFGLQQTDTRMESRNPYAAPVRYDTGQNSVYAQIHAEPVKGLSLTAGERRDHYESFGPHDTGEFALAWSLPSNTVLRASWSQGYKAPSLYQLYSPYGNSHLAPEQSTGWDAGIQQSFGQSRAT